jgi:glycine/D-amino acid oxidase-like deaminating enzyme
VTALGDADVVVLGAGIVGCSFAALVTCVRPELTVALATRDSIFSATNTQLSLGVDVPSAANGHAVDLAVDSAQAREILATISPSLRGRRQNAIRVLRGPKAFVHELPLAVHAPEEVVAQLAGQVHVCGSGVVYENFDVTSWSRTDNGLRIEDSQGRTLSCRYVFVALGSGLVSSPFVELAPRGLDRRRVAAVRLRIEALHWGGAYVFEPTNSFLVSAEQPGTFWMPLDGRTRLAGTEPVDGLSRRDRRELDRISTDYLSGAEIEVLEHRVGDDLYAPPGTPPVVRPRDRIAVATGCGGSGAWLGPGVSRGALRLLGLA